MTIQHNSRYILKKTSALESKWLAKFLQATHPTLKFFSDYTRLYNLAT